jgi:hypothetical protein
MDQAAITAEAKRLMGDYSRKVAPDDITTQTLNGVRIIGEELLKASKDYFTTRKSLQSYMSNGLQFAIPTDSNGDVVSILNAWNLGTNAYVISATATSSGLILVTVTLPSDVDDHGFETDDVVTIHGVAGCTEANGTWKITDVSATTFTLQGSTYANAWTSGGYAFKDEGDLTEIHRIPSEDSLTSDETSYYLRGAYIFVDDNDFDDDLVVTYITHPLAIADIPVRFHLGLAGYCALTLVDLPSQDDPDFVSMRTKQKVAQTIWSTALNLAKGFRPVSESRNMAHSTTLKRGWI